MQAPIRTILPDPIDSTKYPQTTATANEKVADLTGKQAPKNVMRSSATPILSDLDEISKYCWTMCDASAITNANNKKMIGLSIRTGKIAMAETETPVTSRFDQVGCQRLSTSAVAISALAISS